MIPRPARGLLFLALALVLVIPPAIAGRGGRGGGGARWRRRARRRDAAWRRWRDAAWRRWRNAAWRRWRWGLLSEPRGKQPQTGSAARDGRRRGRAPFDTSQPAFGWCQSTGSRSWSRPPFDTSLGSRSRQSAGRRRTAWHRQSAGRRRTAGHRQYDPGVGDSPASAIARASTTGRASAIARASTTAWH